MTLAPLTLEGLARACVVRAAKDSTTRYNREWFRRDEFGTWERDARDLLAKVAGQPWAPTFLVEQVSRHLRYLACTAGINAQR